MTETLKRNVKTNPFYIGTGFAILLCIFFLFSTIKNPQLTEIGYKTEIGIAILILHLVIIFLLYLSNRRFLRELKFDFDNGILRTHSIIKSVIKEYQFEEIKEIKLIKNQGFGNKTNGFRNQNIVIRINKKLQPQIFEVRDEESSMKAEEIIEKINNR